jgi:putative membrane protein
MSLAAERTYLAYLRTGLALMASGVGVAGALPDAGAHTLRRVIGVVLVLAGAGVLIESRRRWTAVERAMRLSLPLPATPALRSLSWLLGAVALVATVLVFLI